jgi:UDP-arabinose 4-epimerase
MCSQTVLVTGGAGYIGSSVCKLLSDNGLLPVSYDNLVSGNRSLVRWGPFVEGDVRDRSCLAEAIKRYNPFAIMLFAGLIQVHDSVVHPASFYNSNFWGTLCLLEEAGNHNIKNIVFSSTAAVYGMPDADSISESHSLNPINPYGHTKLAAERMIRDFSASYGFNHAILRYFNAAGADRDAETGTAYKVDTHIIPLLMRVASGLAPEINVFGTDYDTPDGTAVRDYIHVTDLAEAHLLALKHIAAGNGSVTLNLGTNQGHTVGEVIRMARAVTGHPIPARTGPRRPGDPSVLVADAAKARNLLNWQPVCSDLETIIGTAWQWRQKQNHEDAANDIHRDRQTERAA